MLVINKLATTVGKRKYEQRFKILKCKCGARCWSADDSPCEGKMNVSEEYPMVYIHYCDKHGKVKKQPPDLTAGEFNRSE